MSFFRNIPTQANENLPCLHEVDFSDLSSDLSKLTTIELDAQQAAQEITAHTNLQGKFPRIVSINDRLDMLQMDLSLSGVNSVLLYGPSGSGKTTLVEALLRHRAEGALSPQLNNKPFFLLDTTAFFTQPADKDPVAAFNAYIDRVAERHGVLVIDHMDDLIHMSGGDAARMVNSLVSKLEHNSGFQAIIICENDGVAELNKLSTGISRRFIARDVGSEPKLEDMKPYLMAHFRKYETTYNIKFTEEAATEILRLLKRYPGRAFTEARPGNLVKFANMVGQYVNRRKFSQTQEMAVLREKIGLLEDRRHIMQTGKVNATQIADLTHEIDTACAAYAHAEHEWTALFKPLVEKQQVLDRIERQLTDLREKPDRTAGEDQKFNLLSSSIEQARREVSIAEKSLYPETPLVKAHHVRAVFAMESGVPESLLNENKIARLSKLDGFMRSQIIKQDRAIECLVQAYSDRELEVSDPSQPAGIFLFTGGTGLGKTESTKALANFDGGDDAEPVILRLNEYKGAQAGKRLTGADPGFVGYEDGSSLDEVRKNNRAILLLDEMDKADNSVPDTFMQVFDDGKLTVSNSKEPIDFRGTIIVITTNALTAQNIPQDKWRDGEYLRSELAKVINPDTGKPQFKPEFLGRVHEVVLFEPFAAADSVPIMQKALRALNRDYETRGLSFEMSDETAATILTHFDDPTQGGRLSRNILKKYLRPVIRDYIFAHPTPDDDEEKHDMHLQVEFSNGKLVLQEDGPAQPHAALPHTPSAQLNAA